MYSVVHDPEGPGFPIRISTDQSLFAAPHGFSQRTTSFIASCRQGIHQMLLVHLITLIINAHLGKEQPAGSRLQAKKALAYPYTQLTRSTMSISDA